MKMKMKMKITIDQKEVHATARSRVGGTPGSPLPPPGPSGCIISLAFTSWVPGGTCCSRGNPGFFREFFTEKFITVNAHGNFQPKGPGGGKGYRGHTARSAVKASTLRREAPL
jgi:hypothetical protein